MRVVILLVFFSPHAEMMRVRVTKQSTIYDKDGNAVTSIDSGSEKNHTPDNSVNEDVVI